MAPWIMANTPSMVFSSLRMAASTGCWVSTNTAPVIAPLATVTRIGRTLSGLQKQLRCHVKLYEGRGGVAKWVRAVVSACTSGETGGVDGEAAVHEDPTAAIDTIR